MDLLLLSKKIVVVKLSYEVYEMNIKLLSTKVAVENNILTSLKCGKNFCSLKNGEDVLRGITGLL